MKKSPIHLVSNLAVATLLASVVVQLIGMASMLPRLGSGEPFKPSEPIASLSMVLGLATGVVLAVWFARALRSARARGAEGMRFQNGWPWFLVPVVNFYKPMEAMEELWKASHAEPGPAEQWQRQPIAWVLPVWWVSWVLAMVLGLMGAFQTSVDGSVHLTGWSAAGAIVGLVSTWFEIVIIRRIAAAQAPTTVDGVPSARVVS